MSTRRLLVALAAVFGLVTIAGLAGMAPSAPATEPAGSRAGAARFTIDGTHSKAFFGIRHLGASNFYGRFNHVSGWFTHEEGGMPAFDVTIDIASVDTATDALDNHLKGPDFFNAREFPVMTFKSEKATLREDGAYDVAGTISIHGIEKNLTARVEFVGAAELGPQSGYRAGFETRFTIDRTEFDMTYGVDNGALGRAVSVHVSLEGKRD